MQCLKLQRKKWGIGARRINVLCSEGRIQGATKLRNMWAIPVDSKKPADARIKSGNYIRENQR